MGAGASVSFDLETLTAETYDEAAANAALGEAFNQEAFDGGKGEDGTVTKAQIAEFLTAAAADGEAKTEEAAPAEAEKTEEAAAPAEGEAAAPAEEAAAPAEEAAAPAWGKEIRPRGWLFDLSPRENV